MNNHYEQPDSDLDLLIRPPSEDFSNPGEVIDSGGGGDGAGRYAYSSLMAALVTPAIRSPLSFIRVAHFHEGPRTRKMLDGLIELHQREFDAPVCNRQGMMDILEGECGEFKKVMSESDLEAAEELAMEEANSRSRIAHIESQDLSRLSEGEVKDHIAERDASRKALETCRLNQRQLSMYARAYLAGRLRWLEIYEWIAEDRRRGIPVKDYKIARKMMADQKTTGAMLLPYMTWAFNRLYALSEISMSDGDAWRRYTAQMMAGMADADGRAPLRRRWLRGRSPSRGGSDDSQEGPGAV